MSISPPASSVVVAGVSPSMGPVVAQPWAQQPATGVFRPPPHTVVSPGLQAPPNGTFSQNSSMTSMPATGFVAPVTSPAFGPVVPTAANGAPPPPTYGSGMHHNHPPRLDTVQPGLPNNGSSGGLLGSSRTSLPPGSSPAGVSFDTLLELLKSEVYLERDAFNSQQEANRLLEATYKRDQQRKAELLREVDEWERKVAHLRTQLGERERRLRALEGSGEEGSGPDGLGWAVHGGGPTAVSVVSTVLESPVKAGAPRMS